MSEAVQEFERPQIPQDTLSSMQSRVAAQRIQESLSGNGRYDGGHGRPKFRRFGSWSLGRFKHDVRMGTQQITPATTLEFGTPSSTPLPPEGVFTMFFNINDAKRPTTQTQEVSRRRGEQNSPLLLVSHILRSSTWLGAISGPWVTCFWVLVRATLVL